MARNARLNVWKHDQESGSPPAVDRNGDVWLAYGASPPIHPARIARLRVNDP